MSLRVYIGGVPWSVSFGSALCEGCFLGEGVSLKGCLLVGFSLGGAPLHLTEWRPSWSYVRKRTDVVGIPHKNALSIIPKMH